ncbi:conserved hypothetical protein [Talaromyces stipitatus ATCC 10500]|uniref:Zn(2)-C6 fungal-type domain-containing protein n=1 Tax=Talaromyces stipitatus (strain ATCC 10500 / CBS 375.48 / QM 6759 / NRRL 1006) TaxID=441959 RepID=B8LUN0_TALSN|nr:uncharacterized protein TSTA_072770 [Talaromyces stipitatus ATCC 10500]EED23887.1 conserved hypothetical protein [Talaromyces stipitatus ATCC 10500]
MDGKPRLQKACDACNIRKVKCDEGGPPCKSCISLDIPCTFDRPKKRRGPPNKHAEALKKQKAQPTTPPATVTPALAPAAVPTPISIPPPLAPVTVPTTATATGTLTTDTTVLDQNILPLSGESICSLPTLQLLVDDFFLFIHPLIPIPHEPTFREAFARREDLTNGRFLALLAAVIGSLVASFPRRPRLHLRTDSAGSRYSNSMAFAKRCHDIAVQARGLGYLDTSTTVEDAAISYHLSLCSSYVYNHQRSRMYLGECMTILRVYGLYKPSRQGGADLGGITAGSPISEPHGHLGDITETTENYLVQEQGRRLFYICLAGLQTLHQLGSADGRTYIPPETPTNRYPPFPLEVDDEFITSNQVTAQPVGVVSQLTGFNANVRIFQCYNPLLALEIAFNDMQLVSWERQRQLIWESLQKAKKVTAELPPELSLNYPQELLNLSSPSIIGGWPSTFGESITTRDQERRRIQYEIQKVNIYISSLSTRSYLVEKYWILFEGHIRLQKAKAASAETPSNVAAPFDSQYMTSDTTTSAPDAEFHAQTDQIGQMMRQERGLVIKDLLCLLKSVQEIHIEPNGASFTHKVRQIASTLLNLPQEMSTTLPPTTTTTVDPVTGTPTATETTPSGPQPLSTSDAENYLRTFLNILVRLEGVGVTGSDPIQSINTVTDNLNMKPDDLDMNLNSTAAATTTLLNADMPMEGNNNINDAAANNSNNIIATTALLNDPLVSAAAAYPSPNHNEAFLLPMSYTGDGMSGQEEEELRQWANLKEFQKSFVEDGGLLYST